MCAINIERFRAWRKIHEILDRQLEWYDAQSQEGYIPRYKNPVRDAVAYINRTTNGHRTFSDDEYRFVTAEARALYAEYGDDKSFEDLVWMLVDRLQEYDKNNRF